MYLVLVPLSILFVLRYAKKVKADPSTSLVGLTDEDRLLAARGGTDR